MTAASYLLDPDAQVWVDGHPTALVRETLGDVDFPTGHAVASTSDWNFDGISLPPAAPGSWAVERIVSSGDTCFALVLGPSATVTSWRKAPAEVEKQLARNSPADHVVYDAQRLAEIVAGLRGVAPWDFGPSHERAARSRREGAFVVEVGGIAVGVVVDLTRQRSGPALWLGSDAGGDVVALFFDLQGWSQEAPEPEEPAGERVVRSVDLGALHVGPAGSLLVADPAAGLGGGVRVDIGAGEHPVTLWTLGTAATGPGSRGCALVVGDHRAAAVWERAGGFGVDAGTGAVLDASDAGVVASYLTDEDALQPVLDLVMSLGWSAVEIEGRRAALAFDCGLGDGTYDVYGARLRGGAGGGARRPRAGRRGRWAPQGGSSGLSPASSPVVPPRHTREFNRPTRRAGAQNSRNVRNPSPQGDSSGRRGPVPVASGGCRSS